MFGIYTFMMQTTVMFDMFGCHGNPMKYYGCDSRTGGIHKLSVLTSMICSLRAIKQQTKLVQ